MKSLLLVFGMGLTSLLAACGDLNQMDVSTVADDGDVGEASSGLSSGNSKWHSFMFYQSKLETDLLAGDENSGYLKRYNYYICSWIQSKYVPKTGDKLRLTQTNLQFIVTKTSDKKVGANRSPAVYSHKLSLRAVAGSEANFLEKGDEITIEFWTSDCASAPKRVSSLYEDHPDTYSDYLLRGAGVQGLGAFVQGDVTRYAQRSKNQSLGYLFGLTLKNELEAGATNQLKGSSLSENLHLSGANFQVLR